MGLQRLGDADLPRLLSLVTTWAGDPDPLVQRAAVAGICEPRLLKRPDAAAQAIGICERVTWELAGRPPGERKNDAVRTLRQALGYCWSVAVAADPDAGLRRFEALAAYDDPGACVKGSFSLGSRLSDDRSSARRRSARRSREAERPDCGGVGHQAAPRQAAPQDEKGSFHASDLNNGTAENLSLLQRNTGLLDLFQGISVGHQLP